MTKLTFTTWNALGLSKDSHLAELLDSSAMDSGVVSIQQGRLKATRRLNAAPPAMIDTPYSSDAASPES